MKTQKRWVWISVMTVILIILSACNFSTILEKLPIKLPDSKTPTEAATPVIKIEGAYGSAFADYPIKSVSLPAKFVGGYALPLSAAQVTGLDNLDLTQGQLETILTNGFVVVPPSSDPDKMYMEFYQAYESYRYSAMPVFVTTDSIFHVYHLIFNKMLRDLERYKFIPLLEELTTAMVEACLHQYEQLKGTDLEQITLRNAAYFAVAANLLGLQVTVPSEAQALADQELALIKAHSADQVSPIWNMGGEFSDELLIEDYSQYIPRGHYTRSEELKNYFKTMMWYGRLTFRLKNTIETQRALLMIQAMRNTQTASGRSALELWQDIYDPTVFIVGKADDLSIYEYGAISDQIFGASPELASFGDNKKMEQFFEAAKTLPPPQINSMWVYIWQDRDEATQGFRFMGQRFTLDAYIFGQLIFRNVGTLDNQRSLPKGLDILAAMGSDEAYRLLKDMGETKYENYDSQLNKVKQEVAGLGLDSWTQNLYWSWLYSLQPIFQPKGVQYPAFMQTQAWLHKDLHTALGSWTELKHDTILYAKQVMAEMGGGENEEPPKGYIEPNPEAFARLLALAEMTRAGLANRGMLDDVTQGNLDNLIDELQFFLDVAQKQLKGEAITDKEYWRIQYYGGWLEAMTIAAADPAEEGQGSGYLEDQKSALIADVATGGGMALEEGVGYPANILVVSPVAPYQITIGAVYTYYEFPVPIAERMTDEDWRAMLESGKAPAAPEWTNSFIVP
ncbi:MAG: hypothetical protein FD147_1291 [Chloroflexi bacterium]|nr:MAG: hypothetical protein FD147_1291 [Chloroflexota bacterium]MBA4375493.1 hypothetical protein [Anaerolinea sp.]